MTNETLKQFIFIHSLRCFHSFDLSWIDFFFYSIPIHCVAGAAAEEAKLNWRGERERERENKKSKTWKGNQNTNPLKDNLFSTESTSDEWHSIYYSMHKWVSIHCFLHWHRLSNKIKMNHLSRQGKRARRKRNHYNHCNGALWFTCNSQVNEFSCSMHLFNCPSLELVYYIVWTWFNFCHQVNNHLACCTSVHHKQMSCDSLIESWDLFFFRSKCFYLLDSRQPPPWLLHDQQLFDEILVTRSC